jgi:hypothetical protein
LKANGLERSRIAIQRSAPGKLIESCRTKIDRGLRAPQGDVGQFLELPRLLPLNNRLRSEMPGGREGDQT